MFLFLIISINLITGILNAVWLGGEVPPSLIIWGGASAIFFMLIAKTVEERVLSLLSFLVNNLIICTLFIKPDPCIFIVSLSLILLAAFHLFLWLNNSFYLDLIFFLGLLSRIFFDPMMGSWGFGLVTELFFLRLYSIFFSFLNNKYRSGEGSRIEPLGYLIPICYVALVNLLDLHYSMEHVVMHAYFLFAGASFVYLIVLSERINELIISFIFYILVNLIIGFFLSKSPLAYCQISGIFLFFNICVFLFLFLKAKKDKKALSQILFSHKKEGIQTLLVVYFLVLAALLTQLSTGSAVLALYSNWLQGLGIQIGFLILLVYYFREN